MQALQMFSVYDAKAEAFGQPFYAANKGAGIRTFSDACADPNSMLNKHRSDFSLFHVGEFDIASGQVVGLTAPVQVITALEIQLEDQ